MHMEGIYTEGTCTQKVCTLEGLCTRKDTHTDEHKYQEEYT